MDPIETAPNLAEITRERHLGVGVGSLRVAVTGENDEADARRV